MGNARMSKEISKSCKHTGLILENVLQVKGDQVALGKLLYMATINIDKKPSISYNIKN